MVPILALWHRRMEAGQSLRSCVSGLEHVREYPQVQGLREAAGAQERIKAAEDGDREETGQCAMT